VRSRERGQSTAEFVIILPFLLLFLFLIVDFGWLLKNYIVVTNTAREAARCGAVDRCAGVGDVDSDGTSNTPKDLALKRIEQGLGPNIFDGASFDIHYVDIGDASIPADGQIKAGDSLVVCIKANNEYISPVIPFLSMVTGVSGDTIIPDPLPLKARAEMRVEVAPASAETGTATCSNF
jgi:TadE-like protein